MHAVAFANQKGGVGKTSLAGNVAHIAASQGIRTLAIDGDPQGSLSTWLLATGEADHELADVLRGNIALDSTIINLSDRLSLLPTFAVDGTLEQYAQGQLEEEPTVFADLSDEAKALGFGLIIYDLSPSMGRLERSILVYGVDEVITPLTPEFFSIDGIDTFTKRLARFRRGFRQEIEHSKIVLNLINRSFSRHKLYSKRVHGLEFQLFEISQCAAVAESQVLKQSVIEYDPKARVVPELRRLTNSIVGAT